MNHIVHEQDFIYKFLTTLPAYHGDGKALAGYLHEGERSAVRLRELVLDQFGREDISLLEFASGYGCVTRHLPGVLPQANITACDIHAAAVDFIATQFRVRAIGSVADPDCLNLNRTFDVVFALSFFSHMPKNTWGRWLRTLVRHTVRDGVVIFTTHGQQSVRHFPDYQAGVDGFWFKPISEQNDLDISEYGTTVTLLDFVSREIANSGARLVRFQEALWWGHQDLYVLRRSGATA